MTDVSTTWAEVIFRVKWIVFVRRWCYMSGSWKLWLDELRIKEFENTLRPLYRKEKFTAVSCQSYCYLRLCILTTHKFLHSCSALLFLSMIHITCTLAIFNTVQWNSTGLIEAPCYYRYLILAQTKCRQSFSDSKNSCNAATLARFLWSVGDQITVFHCISLYPLICLFKMLEVCLFCWSFLSATVLK